MKNVNSTKLRSCTLGQQILFHGLVKIVFVLVLLVQVPLADPGFGSKNVCRTFYRPQRSCSKVIFSQACVKNSVNGGGVHSRGHAWQMCVCGRGVHGRGRCTWQGACMMGVCIAGGMHGKRGMCSRGACMAGGMHGRGHEI